MKIKRRLALTRMAVILFVCGLVFIAGIAVRTTQQIENVQLPAMIVEKTVYLTRDGTRLNHSWANAWNATDRVPYEEIPTLLIDAVVAAEDQRYFEHSGADWRARAHAAWQNVRAGRAVRGASTITEQTVRMIHPRPRTLWSRWLEGFDAQKLERAASKHEVLNFYLNQVPYGERRRGIAQAAKLYFGRSLSTLSEAELIGLAVILRAPRWFDPRDPGSRYQSAMFELAERLHRRGKVSEQQIDRISRGGRTARNAPHYDRTQDNDVQAPHLVRWLQANQSSTPATVPTTIDGHLQSFATRLLAERIRFLKQSDVHDGALLAADHRTGHLLVYTVKTRAEHAYIDAARIPRQPGSTLKPLVYALAMETGWRPDTLIADTPLETAVGNGLHRYRNYNRGHAGPVTLRYALGNSLNIPAVRVLDSVGADRLVGLFLRMGVALPHSTQHYGNGLALGNAEINLVDLLTAYATLANSGRRVRLSALPTEIGASNEAVLSKAASRHIEDILSDPYARADEFGLDSILNFERTTAVKTGTSTGYKDAWTFAYDGRFVVGAWFGNLDGAAMINVTGASGPAPVVRALMHELNERAGPHDRLLAGDPVNSSERKSTPNSSSLVRNKAPHVPRWIAPTDGLVIALDPRVPDHLERFRFEIDTIDSTADPATSYEWDINGEVVATTDTPMFDWLLKPGHHRLTAKVLRADVPIELDAVSFLVR